MLPTLLLSSYLIAPLPPVEVKVKETKLVQLDKKKVAAGSISLSRDFLHFTHASPNRTVYLDGKVLGTYLDHGTVIFSGSNDDYAFIAQLKPDEPPVMIKNGKPVTTDGQIARLFRTHDLGALAYLERVDKKFRLVTDYGKSPLVSKIENLRFSDDGGTYVFAVTEEKRDADGVLLSSDEFLCYSNSDDLAPRPGIIGYYPANDHAFMTTTNFNDVRFRGQTYRLGHARFNGRPVFSPDGKSFGFKVEQTAYTKEGVNIEQIQYNVNGNLVTDFQRQTGLTFSDDSKLWVLCGMNGKNVGLYLSNFGPVKYSDFPGLESAPQEPYKWAKFLNNKLMLMFQAPRANPTLFMQDLGTVDLGTLVVVPDSISISPDGRYMVFGGQLELETHAFMVDLQFLGPAVEITKPGYDLQMLGSRTFYWTGNNTVNFAILRNNFVCRAEATL